MTPLTYLTQPGPTQPQNAEKMTRTSSELKPSACRCCQFYKSQGRSGGYCQQLGVPVRGTWHSCPLALPPFAPSWEGIPESGNRHVI